MNVLGRPARIYPLEGDLPYSDAGRCYAHVVDQILRRNPSAGQLLVTSPGRGDGKTVTAANLALAFQARHIPILLLELSLMEPQFSGIFGKSPRPWGVEDVLGGRTDLRSVVSICDDNQLHVATVDRAQQNEDALAPSVYLDRLLSDAKREYQWTIIDGPAVQSPYFDTLVASVGMCLMVARSGRTEVELLKEAISRTGIYRPLCC